MDAGVDLGVVQGAVRGVEEDLAGGQRDGEVSGDGTQGW